MTPSARAFLRRIFPVILLALLAGSVAFPIGAAAQVCGDLNASGGVTTSDALSLLRFSVGQPVELVCGGDCEAIEPRVQVLEESLAIAQAMIAELTELLDGVERDDDSLVFSGMNLQVVDGTGGTDGPGTGVGNIIIGYNEELEGRERNGSHNLIVGPDHDYTSFAGIVAGESNTISARGACVTGGRFNWASGANSSVSGGSDNRASNQYASVGAGFSNLASGLHSTVSGGCENTASNTFAAVSGGQSATASGQWSSVTGGFNNKSTASHSATSGGSSHTSAGQFDWRAGALFEDQ